MTTPNTAWFCNKRFWHIAGEYEFENSTQYTRADLCIRRDDPVLVQAMESLKLYAGGCDATETAPCGYEGNLCCMSARAALAALQELIGKT